MKRRTEMQYLTSSSARPGVSAMMISPNLVACRQASGLLLGMHTIQVDSLERGEELIEETMFELLSSKMMELGEPFIVISGRAGSLKERLVINYMSEGKSHGRFIKGGGHFFNRGLLLSFGTF
jgi:pyruvate kinase